MVSSPVVDPGFWGWLESHSGAATALATVVLVLVTAAYVLLTRRLVKENHLARRVATRPTVSIHARPGNPHINLVFLVVENLGPGPAWNVRFTTNRDVNLGMGWTLRELGLFKRGLGYMPPGWREEYLLFNAASGIESFGPPLEIVVQYKDLDEETDEAVFVIDIGEFEHTGRVGKPPLYEIAEHLKAMTKAVGTVVNADGLSVVSRTPKDLRLLSERMRLLLKLQRNLSEDETEEVLRLLDDPLELARILELAKRGRRDLPDSGST